MVQHGSCWIGVQTHEDGGGGRGLNCCKGGATEQHASCCTGVQTHVVRTCGAACKGGVGDEYCWQHGSCWT